MPRIKYTSTNFHAASRERIEQANAIIDEYAQQGFTLTLRQLYYQFVSRDLIPNSQREYDKLGKLISNARLAGLIDWSAIEDRTRWLRQLPAWQDPTHFLENVTPQYRLDPWVDQDDYLEVWIEKDALIGVIEGVCETWGVPYFACRGYVSQSEQWRAGRRWLRKRNEGKRVTVLHLGDHDPSGIDMSRDNNERGGMFSQGGLAGFRRLALNMDQVNEYNPPPNPAKMSDSRFETYVAEYGSECWELDALEPAVISELIDINIQDFVDPIVWDGTKRREIEGQEKLAELIEGLG